MEGRGRSCPGYAFLPTHPMHANLLQKTSLVEFWDRFGGEKSRGLGFSKEVKIQELQRLADLVTPFKNQKPLRKRRAHFEEVKYDLHRMSLQRNARCWCCGSKAECRHHIIQLQHGGLNSRKNLVSLCFTCHAEIHPWLK